MNIKAILNLANRLSYLSGFYDVIGAALDGQNQCIIPIIVCEGDEVAPRKIVDEYKHIGLNASWEECDSETYKVGDDVVSKYFIKVTW